MSTIINQSDAGDGSSSSSSSGSGGGIPLGGLVETSAFAPTLTNHRKATAKHILKQADFPALYAELGQIADNAFRFSELSDTSPGNNVDDMTTNIFTLVHDDSGRTQDALAIIHAEGDTWFMRRSSQLFISTTGSEGPFTEITGITMPDPGNHNRSMAYNDGYLVCMTETSIITNTVQNDFTTWTTYQLGDPTYGRMRYLIVAKGYFFVLWIDSYDAGSYNISWTDDPRFAANWTDFDTGFNLLGGWLPSATNGSDFLAYFPGQDKIVAFMAHNYTAADRHYFEIWYMTDPVTENVFTENTAHNALWSYVANADNTLIIGAVFEQAGSIIAAVDIIGSPRFFIWDDITTSPTRVYADGDLQIPAFPVRASILDIPQLLPNGGVLTAYNGIIYRYWYDGLNVQHGRTDQQDYWYNEAVQSWNNQASGRCWTYDESKGLIITYLTPDSTETQDVYRWAWPIYTYDTATDFAVMPVSHTDPDIIYQTRVA